MEYNSKAKLKEQNSSRLTEPKGLGITKGKGLKKVGAEGGRRGLRGVMISTHNVGGITRKAV